MLTTEEREFYDVWFNEDCSHLLGYATTVSRERGITYDHYSRMWPFYHETWQAIGLNWPDGFPPIPNNLEPPCPWPTKEDMEARLDELETGPLSHLTNQAMRDWMLRNSPQQAAK
jgi:hypothetical protein